MFKNIKKFLFFSFSLILFLGLASVLINTENAYASTCTDSDGGKDYYTYGYGTDPTIDYITFVDSCGTINDYSFLGEVYCDNNEIKVESYVCPNGCENGACIKEEAQSETVCTDSDDGKDYYKKGTVDTPSFKKSSAFQGAYTDTCDPITGAVNEYYCVGSDDANYEYYQCPYGCMNGQCLKEGQTNTVPTCVDSDSGKDYYVKGKLNYKNNPYGVTEEQDICLNKDYLLERFCSNSEDIGKNREKYLCPNGCQNGACVKQPIAHLPEGTLIKIPNDPKIYVIKGSQKQWIKSPEEFQQQGYKWENVQEITAETVNSYSEYLSPQTKLLKLKNSPMIYYITESGMKRHIPSEQVFNSYGDQWEDVVEVDENVINSYKDNNLIIQKGNSKVYELKNGIKQWIKTAEAFNRLGYDWTKIAPVNEMEMNTYQEGNVIE